MARISGNPWNTERGRVLDCRSYEELVQLYSSKPETPLRTDNVDLPYRSAMRFLAGLSPMNKLAKTLTTSQTFDTGFTAPVSSDTCLGFKEAVTPLPIACFLEPWAESVLPPAIAAEYRAQIAKLQEPNPEGNPLRISQAKQRKIGRLLSRLEKQCAPTGERPKTMGRNPLFYFNISDQAMCVPQQQIDLLEKAALDVFCAFSQFATLYRTRRTTPLTDLIDLFEFDPNQPYGLETYMLAIDFMRNREGKWAITDVGGLGGGAIADIAFCRKITPESYADPAKAMAEGIASYRLEKANLVQPIFGMNVWEMEQLSRGLSDVSQPFGISADAQNGMNILLSVKPTVQKSTNTLPTPEFSALYSPPVRSRLLQRLRTYLDRKYCVQVPKLLNLETLVEKKGDKTLAYVEEELGRWVVYRGPRYRTGPLPICEVERIMKDPEGVLLEELCPPWLELTKATIGSTLTGEYAAELRLYLGVEKND